MHVHVRMYVYNTYVYNIYVYVYVWLVKCVSLCSAVLSEVVATEGGGGGGGGEEGVGEGEGEKEGIFGSDEESNSTNEVRHLDNYYRSG